MLNECDLPDDKSNVTIDLKKTINEGHNLEINNSSENLNDIQINKKNDHYHPEIRLLKIQKDPKITESSCGFNLTRSKWDPYPWVSAVDQNSPAFNAGLKVGDCILEVNKEDVLGLRISEIANLVKIKSDNLLLLLWSPVKDPTCDENSLCCGPMPLSLERLSASMQTILACLECPVCMDIVPAPVTQCQNGHILCIKCRSKSEKCPICRQHYSCVRSLIAEQIYSSILDAFKLNNNDSDNNDIDSKNDDMHMNNIRLSGRKLREKLFGAKYKKKQHQRNQQQQQQQQQSLLFETTNFKSTTIEKQPETTITTITKIKSASTIGINDTTTTTTINNSYDLNFNNDKNFLNKGYQNNSNQYQYQHGGSSNLLNNYNNGILTPTNRFLAKILGKAYSLENLSSGNTNSSMNTMNSNSINNSYNNKKVILDEIHYMERKTNKENFKQKQQQQPLEQQSKIFAGNNYLEPSNYNIGEVKQFSQSTNDLSSSSTSSLQHDNHHNHQYCFQDNKNSFSIAIPRCPSLNRIPTNISLSSSSPSLTVSTVAEKTALETSEVTAASIKSNQKSGSLKGLNEYNNNICYTMGYTNDNTNVNDNDNDNITDNCGIIMSRKANSNVSLSVNNLHSGNTTSLILHKRPSTSVSELSLVEIKVSKSSPSPSSSQSSSSSQSVAQTSNSLLSISTKNAENVEFTDAVNQCITLLVPKVNKIKKYHNIDVKVDNYNNSHNDNDDDDDDNSSDSKKIKIVKLSDDVGKFLCPYDCCDDKFNVPSLLEHIKYYHLVPIISFGKSTAQIALPLKEPMNLSIIELILNENIFWIKLDVNGNGSILATALFQGTEDESSTFIFEGQLQNRVDDKILEKNLITRSMVYSMMKSSWNQQKNFNSISNLLVSEKNRKENMVGLKLFSVSTKSLNKIENNKTKNIIEPNTITKLLDNNNVVTNIENINNIDINVCDDDDDEFNIVNGINNNLNQENFNLKNCVNINSDESIDYNLNETDNKIFENILFHDSCIKSTFKDTTELLLNICVKYR